MTERDTLKKQMDVEMKENENPYQIVKMTECPACEVPCQIRNMTECEAYMVLSLTDIRYQPLFMNYQF